MIACTRCGRWHEHAESVEDRRLTCTEVKQFWAERRLEHRSRYGHFPQIATDDNGAYRCIKCGQPL